jgi:4,5-dihydroxyphthalate decarboxylase
VCEFSLATYIVLHDRAELPLTAIPAFPHRRFRHGYIFVNRAAGIRSPEDLNGRRVGIRTWETTAGFWLRGILADDYGVDLTSIDWITQDPEDVPLADPSRFRIRRVDSGETVTAMLADGALDALLYPETPESIRGGDPRVAPLFPDAKRLEIAYAQRTGFFPIMHTVVVQQRLVEAHPWLPEELLGAFRRSKDAAFARMADPRRVSLAWFHDAMEEQTRILGPDPWSYEFEPNRMMIETMIRWAHEQGMIRAPFDARDLFVPATLEAPPVYV